MKEFRIPWKSNLSRSLLSPLTDRLWRSGKGLSVTYLPSGSDPFVKTSPPSTLQLPPVTLWEPPSTSTTVGPTPTPTYSLEDVPSPTPPTQPPTRSYPVFRTRVRKSPVSKVSPALLPLVSCPFLCFILMSPEFWSDVLEGSPTFLSLKLTFGFLELRFYGSRRFLGISSLSHSLQGRRLFLLLIPFYTDPHHRM